MLPIQSEAHGVRIPGFVGRIRLRCDGSVILERILSDAVVEQISDRVRLEMQTGIADGERGLHVEQALGVLPAGDGVLREFVLPLVQVIAQILALTENVVAERGLEAHLVRNLELIVRGAENQRHTVLGI